MAKKEEFFTARGYEITAGEGVLTPSMEDYMEMLYRLSRRHVYIRVNDLAEKLNVQPPSVTKMIKKLHDKELLNYKKYGMIHLTEEGRRVGEFLLQRHNTIKEFLSLIGAGPNLQRDVEQIEHYVNPDVYESLQALVKFFHSDPEVLRRFFVFKSSLSKLRD